MDNIVTDFGVGASPIGMNMQWAIWKGLYDFGFNLLPLTGDKKPIEKFLEWTEKRQPVETFERFYTKLSPPQMAIHTGLVWHGLPGFVVIDPDDEAASDMVDELLPPTPMMVRSRRGFHRFYLHPGGYIPQRIGHTIDGVPYKIDRKADPAWDEKEIRHKVRDAIRKAVDYPGIPGDKLDLDRTEELLERGVLRLAPRQVASGPGPTLLKRVQRRIEARLEPPTAHTRSHVGRRAH